MDTETQRVLLALEKEVLKWDAHDDTKLHLQNTVSHVMLLPFFFRTWNSQPSNKQKKNPTNRKLPQTKN